MRKSIIAAILSAAFLTSCGVFADGSGTINAESPITFSWTPPTSRVNGETLDPATDLVMYSLRCFEAENPQNFKITEIQGGATTEYATVVGNVLPDYGYYQCELAAVDRFGLYSDYVLAVNESGEPIAYIPNRPSSVLDFESSL